MNDIGSDSRVGFVETIERFGKILGFHDLMSFSLFSVTALLAISFVISCVIFLIKKRKERLAQLEEVVREVQKEFRSFPSDLEIAEKEKALPAIGPEGKKLKSALLTTRSGFMAKLADIFGRRADISEEDLEEIEAILFSADIGVKTAQKILDVLRERVRAVGSEREFLRQALKEEMLKILNSAPPKPLAAGPGLQVLMFVGVNGAGKTTTMGKLGARLKSCGKTVVFGAGDTFRAAATKQLEIWGERIDAKVISGKENADPASVLFDAIENAKIAGADYVLCDTAGRLHTKTSLMDELKKVHRVMQKAREGAPHEVFLVIDATMGQNAIVQAKEFAMATPLTGIILSKLDGTAKGGVALGIVDELQVPIRYVGIGEGVDDLKEFDAAEFVDALFER